MHSYFSTCLYLQHISACPPHKEAAANQPFQCKKTTLVSWCFEPSQPLGIISGLKTNFTPSLSYSAHQSFNTSKQTKFEYNAAYFSQNKKRFFFFFFFSGFSVVFFLLSFEIIVFAKATRKCPQPCLDFQL